MLPNDHRVKSFALPNDVNEYVQIFLSISNLKNAIVNGMISINCKLIHHQSWKLTDLDNIAFWDIIFYEC